MRCVVCSLELKGSRCNTGALRCFNDDVVHLHHCWDLPVLLIGMRGVTHLRRKISNIDYVKYSMFNISIHPSQPYPSAYLNARPACATLFLISAFVDIS